MKWVGIYMTGFVIFILGLLAALWKAGILVRIGAAWTMIGLVIALGIGLMISVAAGGGKGRIEIGR